MLPSVLRGLSDPSSRRSVRQLRARQSPSLPKTTGVYPENFSAVMPQSVATARQQLCKRRAYAGPTKVWASSLTAARKALEKLCDLQRCRTGKVDRGFTSHHAG